MSLADSMATSRVPPLEQLGRSGGAPARTFGGAELELVIIDSHRGVRTLVRIHPDHRHHCEVLLGVG